MMARSLSAVAALVMMIVIVPLVPAAADQAPVKSGGEWKGARTPDGQPDVRGVWGTSGHPKGVAGTHSIEKPRNGGLVGLSNEPPPGPSRVVDPADERIPYQPWAAALVRAQGRDWINPTKLWHIDTQNRCLPRGVARNVYGTEFRILQSPGYVVLLSDRYERYRIIRLSAPHLAPHIKLWEGDPIGHWEGNTLVVDVTNLNGKPRLTIVGDFYSEKAHVVERFRFTDEKTLEYTATFDDPTVYTRPWTLAVFLGRIPSEEVWEFACHEGEAGRGWPSDTSVAETPR